MLKIQYGRGLALHPAILKGQLWLASFELEVLAKASDIVQMPL